MRTSRRAGPCMGLSFRKDGAGTGGVRGSPVTLPPRNYLNLSRVYVPGTSGGAQGNETATGGTTKDNGYGFVTGFDT